MLGNLNEHLQHLADMPETMEQFDQHLQQLTELVLLSALLDEGAAGSRLQQKAIKRLREIGEEHFA